MDLKEYISSGILELYVCGALSEKESAEVSAELKKHPEIVGEVEEIELALQDLAIATAPYNPEEILQTIKRKLDLDTSDIRSIAPRKKSRSTQIVAILGWAASIALLIGLFFVMKQNRDLHNTIKKSQIKNSQLEQNITDARNDAQKTKELLSVFRNQDILKVKLKGQKIAPDAYAEVYWDKKHNQVYVDAKGLPTPPKGKAYQVWSLTLNPLTPKSIGLLSDFTQDDNKVFKLPSSSNSSEAFAITLEPEGGSKTPTMSQLYTKGAVKTS